MSRQEARDKGYSRTITLEGSRHTPNKQTADVPGLITLDDDAKLLINALMLGERREIDRGIVLGEEARHPVANALATLLSGIPGLNYETIIAEHNRCVGFRVIDQGYGLQTFCRRAAWKILKRFCLQKKPTCIPHLSLRMEQVRRTGHNVGEPFLRAKSSRIWALPYRITRLGRIVSTKRK